MRMVTANPDWLIFRYVIGHSLGSVPVALVWRKVPWWLAEVCSLPSDISGLYIDKGGLEKNGLATFFSSTSRKWPSLDPFNFPSMVEKNRLILLCTFLPPPSLLSYLIYIAPSTSRDTWDSVPKVVYSGSLYRILESKTFILRNIIIKVFLWLFLKILQEY